MTGAPDILRAFPSSAIDDRLGGMSLRDWFAGQAMAGDLASYAGVTEGLPAPEVVAERAYRHADAMMAMRELSLPQARSKAGKLAGSDCDHGFTDIFDCPECRPF